MRRQVEPVAVLDGWADQLAALGIRHVAGRLVGDDNAFDEQSFGQGWSWEDLHDGYSAPIGALQVYEDAVTLSVAAGASPGAPPGVAFATPGSGWAIDNHAVTGEPGSPLTIDTRRTRGHAPRPRHRQHSLRVGGGSVQWPSTTPPHTSCDCSRLPWSGAVSRSTAARSISTTSRPAAWTPRVRRWSQYRLTPASGDRPPADEGEPEPVWRDAAPGRRSRRRTRRDRSRRQGGRSQRVEGVGRSCRRVRDGRRLRTVALQLRHR